MRSLRSSFRGLVLVTGFGLFIHGPAWAQDAGTAPAAEAPPAEAAPEAPPAEPVSGEAAPPPEAPPAEAPPAPEAPPVPDLSVPAPEAPPAPPPEAIVAPVVNQPTDSGKVEDLYITGSAVRRVDLVTPAPVKVITREEIDASGLVSVGEILQNLPIQANAVNTQVNNSGDGSTRVDLRGIGTARTLVLLNGRRMVPGGLGANDSVDLNSIPAEIIESIQILKDGASAYYGSDAIAGVVNIITRKDYAGTESNFYVGTSKNGGFTYQLGATAGEVTEKGSFLLHFNYFKQQDILAGQRQYAKEDLDYDWEKDTKATVSCAVDPNVDGCASPAGSTRVPEGLIIDRGEDPNGNAAWQRIVAADTDEAGIYFNDPEDGWRVFQDTGNSDTNTGDFYNFAPENYLLTPNERLSFYGQGDYQIFRHVKAYFEALYTGRRSEQLLAPEPLDLNGYGLTLSAQSVYNPFGRDFIDVRRRLVEAGSRTFDQSINTYRAVVGLNGDFPEDLGVLSRFTWDANFVYGITEGTNIAGGSLNVPRLQNAIGPSFIDGAGVATCGTPDAPIDGCVPLNLFGGAGTITPEMLKYLQYRGVAQGFSDQRILSLQMSGEIFDLMNNPVSLGFGYQNRAESGASLPDPLTASGDTTGNAEEPVEGNYLENAGFAELNVPIGLDVVGAKMIELTGQLRVSDYDTFGTDTSWKVGARWVVIDSLTLRGTYSRAYRAPNVSELYSGQAESFESVTDPCDTSEWDPAEPGAPPNPQDVRNVNATDQCRRDGVPDDYRDLNSQQRAIFGGNPDLQAETANVATAGLVITPKINKWTDNLSLTADYFNIAIKNGIQAIGTSVILNQCYNQPEGERQYCDKITRNQQGVIDQITDVQVNIGGTNTSGLDLALLYALPTDYGRFRMNLEGTFTFVYEEVQADGKIINGKGVYDLETVFPDLKLNFGLGWNKDGFMAGYNLRYIGGIEECEGQDCSEEAMAKRRDVAANVTMDLYAGYAFQNPLGLSSLSVGINNLLDQDPPFIDAGFASNTDVNNYDLLGRYFYLSFRHQL